MVLSTVGGDLKNAVHHIKTHSISNRFALLSVNVLVSVFLYGISVVGESYTGLPMKIGYRGSESRTPTTQQHKGSSNYSAWSQSVLRTFLFNPGCGWICHIEIHSRLGYLATGRRGYPKEQACLPKARKRVCFYMVVA